jgi:hypothetical protein
MPLSCSSLLLVFLMLEVVLAIVVRAVDAMLAAFCPVFSALLIYRILVYFESIVAEEENSSCCQFQRLGQ